MIVLFTDFGLSGPYVGQMRAVLALQAPGVPVIDLFHDVPSYDIRAGAYLLPACARDLPPGTVVIGVVDPGVGGSRRPVMVRADHRWYVGPDNGLFRLVARRARTVETCEILWRPGRLSASFHGRDLFAPVAAMLARGVRPDHAAIELATPQPDWPDDLAQVLYIDRFGNAITGLRAHGHSPAVRLQVGQAVLGHARIYSEVPPGQPFWYENSNGLIELAVNQGRADEVLGIRTGDRISPIIV
jgi:S-adenosylmethionine hydrolase